MLHALLVFLVIVFPLLLERARLIWKCWPDFKLLFWPPTSCIYIKHHRGITSTTYKRWSLQSLRVYLRHVTRHPNHHLTDIPATRNASSFRKPVKKQQYLLAMDMMDMRDQRIPPWFLPHPDVSTTFQGIFQQYDTPTTALCQYAMTSIFRSRRSHARVYTDGSTFSSSSAASFVFPSEDTVMNYTSAIGRLQQLLSLLLYTKRSSLSIRIPRHPGRLFWTTK